MARKSKILSEIISIKELSKKVEDIETLEPNIIFIQNLNENASLIVDERINGYVLFNRKRFIIGNICNNIKL